MTNERIAKQLARKVYGTQRNTTDEAVQLFVEKVVLPADCESYTEAELYEYILTKLEAM